MSGKLRHISKFQTTHITCSLAVPNVIHEVACLTVISFIWNSMSRSSMKMRTIHIIIALKAIIMTIEAKYPYIHNVYENNYTLSIYLLSFIYRNIFFISHVLSIIHVRVAVLIATTNKICEKCLLADDSINHSLVLSVPSNRPCLPISSLQKVATLLPYCYSDTLKKRPCM